MSDAEKNSAYSGLDFNGLYEGVPAGTYYYTADHLGSGALITDESGSETLRVVYDEYGNIDQHRSGKWNAETQTVKNAADDAAKLLLAIKFTGQEYDPETGLYYYNARYYDPALGIFTTADTMIPDPEDPFSYNRYTYVRGNPIIYSDPTGHFFAAVIAGAIIGATAEGTHGNIKGWVTGEQKFDWDAAWKGAIAGGLAALAGTGAMAGVSSIVGAGFYQSVAIGAAAGFASGFIGGSTLSWLNGSSFTEGLEAGLKAGAIGAVFGGLMGGAFYKYAQFIDEQTQVIHSEPIPIKGNVRFYAHNENLGQGLVGGVPSLSFSFGMKVMKYAAAAGFLRGFGKSYFVDRNSFEESLLKGFETGAEWGLVAFSGTYLISQALFYTVIGYGFGLPSGNLQISFSGNNDKLLQGASLGLTGGSLYASYLIIPFWHNYYKRRGIT